MVGRYAVTDQAERHRQPIDDRDLDIDVGLLAQCLGSVDPRWPRPDDRNDERGSRIPSVRRGAPFDEFSAHLRWWT